jgi:hypothetical protein
MPPDPAEAVREAGSVRKLRPDEREAVIRSVARAFYDDPAFSFLLPDDARRGRQLARGFDVFAQRIWLRHNESDTTDSAVGGAFWLPPGEWHLSLLTQLAMMPGLIARLGCATCPDSCACSRSSSPSILARRTPTSR